jgi:hypothetical protein
MGEQVMPAPVETVESAMLIMTVAMVAPVEMLENKN